MEAVKAGDGRRLWEIACLIGAVHVALREAAAGEVKPSAIGGGEAREEDIVDHRIDVWQSVAIQEAPTLGGCLHERRPHWSFEGRGG